MPLALKPKDVDCYVSDRVFDGVRAKDARSAAAHIARLKSILQGSKSHGADWDKAKERISLADKVS